MPRDQGRVTAPARERSQPAIAGGPDAASSSACAALIAASGSASSNGSETRGTAPVPYWLVAAHPGDPVDVSADGTAARRLD